MNFCEIPLYRRNGDVAAHTRVDAEDLMTLSDYRWHMTRGYATRSVWEDGMVKRVYLHRDLFGLAQDDPRQVDHINRNRLDNRRENLRVVTRQENCQNHPGFGGSSPHRGVSWHRRDKVWQANVRLNDKLHYLGSYKTEAEAAEAARAFRREHMPGAIDQ